MAEKVTVIVSSKDQASKPISGIRKAFSELGTKIKAILSPANLLGIGLAAITAAVVKSVIKMAELETKMVAVGNLFGATRTEVNKMTTDILEMSKTTPQAVDDLADALFDVVSAGVPAAESMGFLKGAAKLATAGVTNTKTAVDGLTSVMNAFGYEAKDVTKISDKFFAAQQEGKTTIAELSASIGQVAPIAAGMGISFDELVSSMSAMTLGGIRTRVAATGLKAALSNLLKPSEEARDISERLGIEFDANAVKSKGLTNVLKDVIKKTGGSKAAMGKLFGSVEAVNSVLALSADNFSAVNEINKEVAGSIGTTEKAYKEATDTLSAQWKILKNNALAFSSILTRKLVPAFTFLIKKANSFFGIMKKGYKLLSTETKKTTAELIATNEELAKRIEKQENRIAIFRNQNLIDRLQAQIDTNNAIIEENQLTNNKIVENDDLKTTEITDNIQETVDADTIAKQKEVDLLIKNLKVIRKEEEKAEKEKEKRLKKEKEDAIEAAQAIVDAKQAAADSIVDSAKVAAKEERNILKATINFFKDMLKKQVGSAIAARQAELAAFAAANFWNPAGWAAAAAVAGLEVLKNEAYAKIDRFKDGGIVRGSRMTGDTTLVRANAGEMILNKQQQGNLANQLFASANNKTGTNNSNELLREIRGLRSDLNSPKTIKLNGDSFAKATYQIQKRMIRTGLISTKG